MNKITSLLFSISLLFGSSQALNFIDNSATPQPTLINNVTISFEQTPCGEAEEKVFLQSFCDEAKEYCFRNINKNTNFYNGDCTCVSAFAFLPLKNNQYKKELVGIAFIEKIENFNALEIDFITIDSKYRKNGIGTKIIQAISDHYKVDMIKLMPLDEAVGFYQKLGFKFFDFYQKLGITFNENEDCDDMVKFF